MALSNLRRTLSYSTRATNSRQAAKITAAPSRPFAIMTPKPSSTMAPVQSRMIVAYAGEMEAAALRQLGRPRRAGDQGPMGPRSQAAVERQAREAVLFGTAVVPPGLLVRRWRQDFDLALAFTLADATLAAKGTVAVVAK